MVHLDGLPLEEYNRKSLARTIAVVSQEQPWSFDFTVRQYVSHGRYPYGGRWSPFSRADRLAVDDALDNVQLNHLQNRFITELSGGEKQRVILARSLAQTPRILFLDEPGAHLDLRQRKQILDVIKKKNREDGLTVLLVSHDLNLAASFCTRLHFMKNGEIVADGPPEKVCKKQILEDVFETNLEIGVDPWGRPHCFVHPKVEDDEL